MYKLYFRLKNVDYQLVAADLDLSHPYFVSIKDMDFGYEEGLVVNPVLDQTRQRFQGVTTMMVPFQAVDLIEVLAPKPKQTQPSKLVTLVDHGEDETQ